ncbi:MAG TPA: phosphatase PAP2 family protein [Candidatus Babeliales bacterium]|nr:phosphatase PAP2 family protein [Candidatus Babeliales bacterium]
MQLLIVCLFLFHFAFDVQANCVNKKKYTTPCFQVRGIPEFLKETVYLYRSLFTIDTVKVIVGTVPFYLSARMIDESFQTHFYDRSCHKNRRQFNCGFIEAVEKTAFAGSVLLSTFSLWAPDEHVRRTSRLFFVGVVTGLCFKDVVKCAKTNANLRPWNEHFSCKQRAHGGFPSGHMFEASYMMTVWGLEYGIRAWVPLGTFAALMFAVSVNANRHYLSQTIAGTSLGVIFGLATQKAIAYSANQSWSVDVTCNDRIALNVGYRF